MRRKGFTLIELLVVLAIISLLASILLPLFATVRDKARQSACSSNMKQIGLGLLQYLQDYDEHYPCGLVVNPTTNPFGGTGWAGQLMPYVKNSQIFTCPSDPYVPPDGRDTAMSYAYNLALTRADTYANLCTVTGFPTASPPLLGIGCSAVKMTAPTRTVFLMEISGVPANLSAALEGSGSHSSVKVWNANASVIQTVSGIYSPVTEGAGIQVNQPALQTMYAGTFATGYMGGRGSSFGSFGTSWQDPAASPKWGRHQTGATYLLSDGHAKWYFGDSVSDGNAAATSTALQDASCRAEGAANGTHAITQSPI